MSSSDPLLARNWRKSKVLMCHENKERLGLVCFLRERYEERFFEPIRVLIESSASNRGYGFAAMSLCCLLIETVQGYRLGWPSSHWAELRDLAAALDQNILPDRYYEMAPPFDSHHYSSEIAFTSFFNEPKHFAHFPDLKGKGQVFYRMIRCGLLHQAQTKDSWRITTSGKCWDDNPQMKTVNRNLFSSCLKDCFDGLLDELEDAAWDEDPWKCTRKKIWWLAQTS